MPLDRANSDRLVKLLGMLGSDHAGEVANAGAAAHRLLQSAGLTWAEVIVRPVESGPKTWREPADWRGAVSICLGMPGAPLSEWDRSFLFEIAGWTAISARQKAQVDRIVTACRLHARMAA
ncbi:hypothetical protein JL101_036250 (plasmid) [Skermanella rosea]|uniref:hypothetical protein n=1 Tax=Skermanella rosea TaxID=1817965 RepID=UPI001933EB50|nr:hypothetical protein [Skermanella rosea]UEM08148.1 hypothetical protein JL101_036250 [Skermanella rosea]